MLHVILKKTLHQR